LVTYSLTLYHLPGPVHGDWKDHLRP
jgi:hypothetical protein